HLLTRPSQRVPKSGEATHTHTSYMPRITHHTSSILSFMRPCKSWKVVSTMVCNAHLCGSLTGSYIEDIIERGERKGNHLSVACDAVRGAVHVVHGCSAAVIVDACGFVDGTRILISLS